MTIEQYEYKTTPYKHQRETLARSCEETNFALFLEMGLGKSKILIDNMAYLFQAGKISGALIVAPKGVLDNWDINE
ncbi:MAG: hypothetical protein CMM03_03995, partial [Rhodopirellula sp.]|nr:hypothetical protein [Rhodopirellula sp.]